MPAIGLRLRLIVPLAVILMVYGGFHTYLSTRTQREEILAAATQSTLRLANTVRRSTRHAMLRSHAEDVHQIIQDIGEQEDIQHVRILNKEGAIIYSSEASEIHTIVDRKAEACYQCHDAAKPLTRLETSKRTRVFETAPGRRTVAAIEVIYNEPSCWTAACHAHSEAQTLLGVVDVGISLEAADRRVSQTSRRAVAFGFASTFAICGLVGLFIHWFVNRPVKRLLACTQRVAEGKLDCEIQTTRSDELGHLARSFRKMTEDLQAAHVAQDNWAHQLEEEVENKTRDLKLAQAQIVRSEKLSSIGLLAAGVAHELNSPLMGILAFSHLIAKRLPEDSADRDDLMVIVQQTERCATIVRQLLDFSRETPSEKTCQDVHVILKRAIALIEHQSRFHNIVIECHFSTDVPQFAFDAGQIQQVFLNLLINGGEAMSQGGRLTIETRAISSNAGDDTVNQVHIIVRDMGVGIPSENIDRIFDPFFTSKDVGQGTGLGLSVSYGIIEWHGGTIKVDSTPGEGTAFTVILPTDRSDNESTCCEEKTSDER